MNYPEFIAAVNKIKKPVILELGTRRSNPDNKTEISDLFPLAKSYVKSDFMPGIDVDVVADAHKLLDVFWANTFHAIINRATYEHFKRPWIVSNNIVQLLRPGGLFFIQTVQTFVLHGYPNDYYRFSTEALKSLFDYECIEILNCGYDYPVSIESDVKNMSKTPAYLNSWITGKKLFHTEKLIYRDEKI
jgi:SAM-dependent methyltransferase